MTRAADIINFWFGKPDDAEYGRLRAVWFASNPEFDAEIHSHFSDDYEQAARGELESWKEKPHSCLALILLLDQFSRQLFRGTARSFATDPLALATAQQLVTTSHDLALMPVQRLFVYLPFVHSEDRGHQHRAVELFASIADEPGLEVIGPFAQQHREIIERFGRFPHRNAILNRESTPEEIEFLKQPGSSFA